MRADLLNAFRSLGGLGGAAVAIALVALAVLPLLVNPYVVSLVLSMAMYVALAASWNIISGYCGYVSFGHVVFWGTGAYTTAILVANHDVHWMLALPAGGVGAILLAAVTAYPMLKLTGVYFAISTLALAEAVRVFVSYFRGVTGGGGGINLPSIISLETGYFLMVAVAVACVGFTYTLGYTKFGRSLVAIRQNETAAASLGIDTTVRKTQALLASAFFAGLAGAVYLLTVSYIDPRTAFDITITLRSIMMAMFGGIGTVLGPVIGTVAFQSLSEAVWANFPFIHRALLGALIIAIVLLMPQGILPSLRSAWRRLVRRGSSGARGETEGPP